MKSTEFQRYVSAEGLFHKFSTAFETENEHISAEKFSCVQLTSNLVSFEEVTEFLQACFVYNLLPSISPRWRFIRIVSNYPDLYIKQTTKYNT